MASKTSDRWQVLNEDLLEYLGRYESLKEPDGTSDNVRFYRGEICMRPDGKTIDESIADWSGNYRALQQTSTHIQWWFPIRKDRGFNPYAEPLRLADVAVFRENEEMMARVLQTTTIMADFYGFELLSTESESGQRLFSMKPSQKEGHFHARRSNILSAPHNFLWITRISKFLGELHEVSLQRAFVEGMVRGLIGNEHGLPQASRGAAEAARSVIKYLVPTIIDESSRYEVYELIHRESPWTHCGSNDFWICCQSKQL